MSIMLAFTLLPAQTRAAGSVSDLVFTIETAASEQETTHNTVHGAEVPLTALQNGNEFIGSDTMGLALADMSNNGSSQTTGGGGGQRQETGSLPGGIELDPVDEPVFHPDPENGRFKADTLVVTLTCATEDAVIYYTTETGVVEPADPTAESTQYDPQTGIPISSNTTIKAIAIKGDKKSNIVMRVFFWALPDVKVGEEFICYISGGEAPETKKISHTFRISNCVDIDATLTGRKKEKAGDRDDQYIYTVESYKATKLTFYNVGWNISKAFLDHSTDFTNIDFSGADVDTTNINFIGDPGQAGSKMTLVSGFGDSVGTITGDKYKLNNASEEKGKASLAGSGTGSGGRSNDTAPKGLSKTDCKTALNNDGRITGVLSTMEYQKDGASDWTNITGSVLTGLAPGTYHVRTKASGTDPASDSTDLIIGQWYGYQLLDLQSGESLSLASLPDGWSVGYGTRDLLFYTNNDVNTDRELYRPGKGDVEYGYRLTGTITGNKSNGYIYTAEKTELTSLSFFIPSDMNTTDTILSFVNEPAYVDNCKIGVLCEAYPANLAKDDKITLLHAKTLNGTVSQTTEIDVPSAISTINTVEFNVTSDENNIYATITKMPDTGGGDSGQGENGSNGQGTSGGNGQSTTGNEGQNGGNNGPAVSMDNKEATPRATFKATGHDSGQLSGLVNGAGYKYSIVSGSSDVEFTYSDPFYSLSIQGPCTLQIIKKKTGDGKEDSNPQSISITRANAPTGLSKTDCTNASNNDGRITGVLSTMEYQKDGASGWTNITGNELTGLAPGTYHIRTKAAGTALASESTDLTIAEYSNGNQNGSNYTPTQERTANPVFNPSADTFSTDSLKVTLTCATQGAAIYYTAAAGTGTPADPTSGSTPYDPDNGITITDTTTIKAIAVAQGYTDSNIAVKTYTRSVSRGINTSVDPAPGKSLASADPTTAVSTPINTAAMDSSADEKSSNTSAIDSSAAEKPANTNGTAPTGNEVKVTQTQTVQDQNSQTVGTPVSDTATTGTVEKSDTTTTDSVTGEKTTTTTETVTTGNETKVTQTQTIQDQNGQTVGTAVTETTTTITETGSIVTETQILKDADGKTTGVITTNTVTDTEKGQEIRISQSSDPRTGSIVEEKTVKNTSTEASVTTIITKNGADVDGDTVTGGTVSAINVIEVSDTGEAVMSTFKPVAKNPDTISFTGTTGSGNGTVTIPAHIESADGKEYKVTKIAAKSFASSSDVKDITIPATVTQIGQGAFKNSDVKNITITVGKADSLKIGKNAFKGLEDDAKVTIIAKNRKQFKKIVAKMKEAGGKNLTYVYQKA